MNWFQRHLNWSLFLGLIYIPANVSFTIGLIAAIVMFTIAFIKAGGVFNAMALLIFLGEAMSMAVQAQTILSVVGLIVMCLLVIMLANWFLGMKGRSKVFILLFIISWAIGLFGLLNAENPMGGYIILASVASNILSLIVLLVLPNERTAFATDLWDAQRFDTEPSGAHDDWHKLELEYMDTKDTRDAKDAKDVSVASAEAPAATPAEASTGTPAEAPAEVEVTKEVVEHEKLKMPVLLDDTGVVIKCFYHPDTEAVNLCSRCGQYVCSQCNYLTGTHPICRNCWDRRGEVPLTGVDTGAGEGVKLSKSEKLKAEEDERLGEFMLLYEQAAPIISTVIKRGADGSLSPPLDLMEGLKLRPMLEHAQKLSKPDGKELQEAMKDLEQLLLSCIKVAEAAAEFVSSGEQAMPGEAELARLAAEIETANGFMEWLSQRVASLSQPQE